MCTILEMLNALSMETSHFAKIYLTSVSLAFPSLISNLQNSVRVKPWVRIKFTGVPLLDEVQQLHLDKLLIDASLSNSDVLKWLNAPKDYGHQKYNLLGISHSTCRVLVSSKEEKKKKKLQCPRQSHLFYFQYSLCKAIETGYNILSYPLLFFHNQNILR